MKETDVETQHTQETLLNTCVKDVVFLTCSRIRLKPTIEKIVLTDKRGTKVLKVEVSGLIDHEVRHIASGIMGLMTDKGYEPEIDIKLIEPDNSNSDPPL